MKKDTEYTIEALSREHMDEVIELLQHLSEFRPPIETYDDIWESFTAQTHVFSLVAVEGQSVIGYGSLVIENKIRGGKMGHVEDIATSPDKRGKGIGKAIIDALCDLAEKNGCYKIVLQCQAHNIPFYEKCNFTVAGSAMQRFTAK